MAGPSFAQAKIDAVGLEAIVSMLLDGRYLRQIAEDIGVSKHALLDWIAAEEDRSQACARAREEASEHWDEESQRVIEEAADDFALEKAKQLAVHYRWRAKAIAPRKYGDKVQQQHTGADGGPIKLVQYAWQPDE